MTHDSRVNKHEKTTDTTNNWETIGANFIAKILVSGIYLWRKVAPTLHISKIQPQHSLGIRQGVVNSICEFVKRQLLILVGLTLRLPQQQNTDPNPPLPT